MQNIPIQSVPSQTFSYSDQESNQWDISIRFCGQVIDDVSVGQMAFSFTLNGTVLITGITAIPGSLIIPYKYLIGSAGNFLLTTQNQQIADYTQFGLTQSLLYLEPSDLATIQQEPPSLITAADFNPLGALPLRFSPVGYVLS